MHEDSHKNLLSPQERSIINARFKVLQTLTPRQDFFSMLSRLWSKIMGRPM